MVATDHHPSTETSREAFSRTSPEEEVRAPADATTVRERVLDTLQRIAPGLARAELNPGRPLRDQVDLDSMDWLNFVAALQDSFAIHIPEEDYKPQATVEEIVGYLSQRHPTASERRLPPIRKLHLADGRAITIRPIRSDDTGRVRGFLEASSGDSRYRRFQKWIEAPSSALVHFLTDLDVRRGIALVACVPTESDEEIVAEARCLTTSDGGSCELGLLVEDSWQKTGLAGVLMEALIEECRSRGITVMEGSVLADNVPMLQFARAMGFEVESVEGDRTTLHIRRRLRPESASVAGA